MAAKRAAARSRRDEREIAFGVVLEDIRSQMQVVVEAVTSLSGQFDTRLAATEERLSARIDAVVQAVRESSTNIRD